MVISITNLKGGVGKSTISQNLAVELSQRGFKLCIADTDTEQQTSVKWASVRAQNDSKNISEIPVYKINPETISNQVLNTLSKEYDLVLIDGTPALTELTTRIIIMSDIVVTPILASATDLWALDTFLLRFNEAKITKESMGGSVKHLVVLNKYNPRVNLDREINEAIQDMDVQVLETKMSSRVAYKEATVQGLGVSELKDPNALAEIKNLCDEIGKVIKSLK